MEITMKLIELGFASLETKGLQVNATSGCAIQDVEPGTPDEKKNLYRSSSTDQETF
jgi:hypothetical protein